MSNPAKKGKKKSKYSDLEKLAYQLGQIERGKKNPNSKVHDSFNNGLKEKQPRAKKPLL